MTDQPMPPEIAQAIVGVMGEISSLSKDQRNKHNNYDYVSVDAFYAAVGPLMAKHGLIILVDEAGHIIRVSENDKKTEWLEVQYAIVLIHSGGATWGRNLSRTAFVPAAMGAQAFGAAQSYVEKTFLRSLFKIPTGEDDSDAMEQQPLPRGGRPSAQAATPEQKAAAAENFTTDYLRDLQACLTTDEITALSTERGAFVSRLLEAYPDKYKRINDAITAKQKALGYDPFAGPAGGDDEARRQAEMRPFE